MGRVYLDTADQRRRLRVIQDRLGAVANDRDDDDDDDRAYALAPRRSQAPALLDGWTWERVILAVMVAWFLWKMLRKFGKMGKSIKRLNREVRALSAEREIIDV